MIGKLGHEKGLAHFRSAHKEVHPRIEQALHHGGLAGEHLFIEFIHGEGGQIGRGADPAYLPLVFRQIFLRGLVFRLFVCYTLGGCFGKRLSPVWANRRIWGSRFLF